MLQRTKITAYLFLDTLDLLKSRQSFRNSKLSSSSITRFKYAQITSVDMERSVDRFKNSLRLTGQYLTSNHLIQIIIIQFYTGLEFSIIIFIFFKCIFHTFITLVLKL